MCWPAWPDTCERTQHLAEVRDRLDELSWSLLHATLRAAPAPALARMVAQATPHRDDLTGAHHRVLQAISQSTQAATPGLVPPPGR